MKIIKYLKKISLIFAAPIYFCMTCMASEIEPIVSNYNKKDYHYAAQNWSVGYTREGILHFANNDGLLSFDGIKWQLSPLPENKGLRSILCTVNDGKDRIYVGSFEEFGYFESQSDGKSLYTSLSGALKDKIMSNDEIWTILELDGKIFFHAFTNGYLYNPQDGTITHRHYPAFVESVAMGRGSVIYTSAYSLSTLDPESGEIRPVKNLPFTGRMVSVIPQDDFDLIITLNEGIWKYDGKNFSKLTTDIDSELEECSVNRARLINGDIIIGSTLKGCYRITTAGESVWKISTSDRLQSNTILGIGEDIDGNIWLAMDSGVACVGGNTKVKLLNTSDESIGTIYCTYFDAPYLYIGTNQGLYMMRRPESGSGKRATKRLSPIKGNVWFIDKFDEQIICGANDATYELSEGKVTAQLADVAGGSCMDSGMIHNKEVLVMGSYTDLCVFVKKNGRWVFSHRVEGFMEPVSSIDIDFLGNIWAGHMHKGFFRISLSEDLTAVSSMERFDSFEEGQSAKRIHINNIMGRTVFSDGSQTCTYGDMTGHIIPYEAINSRLGRFAGAEKIRKHEGDRYWLIKGEEAALADFSTPDSINIVKVVPYALFGASVIDQRQDIKFSSESSALFSLDSGIGILEDFSPVPVGGEQRLKIMHIALSDRQKLNPHFADMSSTPVIRYKDRLMTIFFCCPRFSPVGDTRYAYTLEGRDKVWNDLGSIEELELNYLKPGRYTLHLKAFNGAMEEIGALSLGFKIRNPFYLTPFAYLIYMLLLFGFVYVVIGYIQRNAKAKENELINKNLEDELKAKSKLIATNTMSLIRKNEILSEIKEEVEKQKLELGDSYPDKYYRKLLGTIESQISSEEDWKIFQHNFDRIHSGFFAILKERYPDLTSADLRFCAYLCLNLTSKEIASMMNISLKGVEAARYRIRKKIGLPSEESLTGFMMNLK
ncbi:MAG: hypothetical protein MJY67_02130 [Bacteroidales bacterium]|nr:hypothetical protein [Bacteroidales bacterium]